MIHNSTPHSIFKISELTRSIAGQLVLISRKSAVNLACSSRYLEEPVLSALWETQSSLFTLLELLPEHTWCIEEEDNGWCGTVSDLDLQLEKSKAEFRVILVQDHGGPIAGGLEQGTTFRVLDASGRLG